MLRLGCPGSLMSLYGPTFHITPVDLCIIFHCNLYISCIMSCGNKIISIVSNCCILPSAYSLKKDSIKFEPINNNLRTLIILVAFFSPCYNCINMTISLEPIEHCNVIYGLMFLNTVELNK